jgi:hypothetical protein
MVSVMLVVLLGPEDGGGMFNRSLVDSCWSSGGCYALEDRTLAKYAATDVLNSTVLCGVMSFTLEKALCFRGTYRIHHQGRRVCEAGNQAK